MEEYAKIYNVKYNGEVVTPMPATGSEKILILGGIKAKNGYTSDDEFYTRYMRNDDKYAYAIISPLKNYNKCFYAFLRKNDDGTWTVLGEANKKETAATYLKKQEYVDVNPNIFPFRYGDDWNLYLEEGSEDGMYYVYEDYVNGWYGRCQGRKT